MDFLNLLKPKVHPSRNGFDLSRKHVFSSKAGILKPCLSVETVPGDTFEIDVMSLTRTMTLNTAAFLRGKQRYDFFFVPYSQLWHPFNQFISQRTDKHSVNQKDHAVCPVIQLSALLDWLTDVHDNVTLYSYDVHGFEAVPQMIENLNLLGYGDFRYILDTTLSTPTIKSYNADYQYTYVNVFRLAAFQHIWYDFYRNKYYDVDNTGGIEANQKNIFSDVDMFNFDDIDCTAFANSQIPVGATNTSDPDSYRLMRLLQPRYVQYKKDLFTSALPGQQFGAVSSVNMYAGPITTSNDSNRWFDTNGAQLASNVNVRTGTGAQNLVQESSPAQGIIHTHTIGSIPQSFDVLALRKAEMLQVWKQRTLRAGNMVDDNFEAHYGVKPYYEDENNVRYLGSFSETLQVNAVEATASSNVGANRAVGDLAATGTCVVNGKKLRFECKDFGVVMCCASFLPESEYNANSIDKANTLSQEFDFFTPEFENIGLEAIPYHMYRFNHGDAANANVPMGYAPRYFMYKEAHDKVFGEFQDEGVFTTLKNWVAPRKITPHFDAITGAFINDMTNMYVDPSILDNIFAIQATAFSSTDCFLNNVYFDIKAIRPMSELGLPQF